jgi:hypothetical protein
MLDRGRLSPALMLLCCACVGGCGSDPADSSSASSTVSSASTGTDASAGSEGSTPPAGSTSDAPTSGETGAPETGAVTTGASVASDVTSSGETTAGETTGGAATTAGVDETAGETTGADETTGGTTSEGSTSTGGDDPWGCEGGDPITVNGAGKYTTLAAAVAAAPPEATITVCAGTYVETVVIDRPMTLIGAGQGETFLDGGGGGTQLLIEAVSVTIEGFTFKNGEAEHNPLGNSLCGGAIAIEHSAGPMEVKIVDSTFTDNHGEYGGAICYDGGANDMSLQKLTLVGVTIEGNSADINGGGLFSYSSTTMTDTTITKNTAGAQGGGIYFSYSDNVVHGGAVKQNTADEGGGMFLQSPVTVDVNASDWGFGQDQENAPNDVQHFINEYGFFGADVSFSCAYIEWNMGMCKLD